MGKHKQCVSWLLTMAIVAVMAGLLMGAPTEAVAQGSLKAGDCAKCHPNNASNHQNAGGAGTNGDPFVQDVDGF